MSVGRGSLSSSLAGLRYSQSGWLVGRKEAVVVAELGSAEQQVVSVGSRFSSRESATHISYI